MRFLLAPLTLALLSSAAHAQSYSSIWNLGDSLSDTGRTHFRTTLLTIGAAPLAGGIPPDLVQPKGPLYYAGRFSNGPVWVEHLSELHNIKYDPDRNLAWGGAVTGKARDIAISAVVKHLEEQVNEEFRPKIDGNTKGIWGTISGWFSSPQLSANQFGDSPLVTLWIGGNNFRQEVEDKDWHNGWFWGSRDFNTPKNTLLQNVPANLRRINESFLSRNDIGRNGVTYYVPTVPDVSTTPKFASEPVDARAALGGAVMETNRGLKSAMYELEDQFKATNPATRIVVIDTAALLAEVQNNPGPFGFKYTSENCVNDETGKYTNGCSASNVDDYLFWDRFHPTTKAHNMIAKYAYDTDRAESGHDISLTFPHVANIEIRNRAFEGAIGGTGSLIKKGEATLTLAGNNTYSGGTRIDRGTIRVSSDRNLGAATGLLTMRGGTLNNSQSFTMSRNVRIEPAVWAPVLPGDTSGSKFGATFNTDAGTTLTLQDNVIYGKGDIEKTGAGSLDLRSTMDSGRELTQVTQGTLKINTVNEYRSTEVHISEEGILGGAGTIVGTVKNAGFVSPGNSIGTLTIAGDYIQEDAGSVVLEVDTHRSDAFHVEGAMHLDGDVHIALDPTDKIVNQTFTFATTEAQRHGVYDEVHDLSPFLSQTLHYEPTSVSVSFSRDFHAPARTEGQRVMADYLGQAYSLQSQGDLDTIYFALDHTVTNEGGAAALDTLSGSALGNITTADALQRSQFVRAIEDRMAQRRSGQAMAYVTPAAAGSSNGDPLGANANMQRAVANVARSNGQDAHPSHRTVWGRVFGGPGDISGAHGFDMDSAGVILGADTSVGSGLVGVSLAYGNMRTKSDDRVTSSDADAYQLSLYGSANAGQFFVDGTAAYTYVDIQSKRRLEFGGLGRQAHGSPTGHDLSLATKAGVRVTMGGWDAEPSLGLDWYRLHRSGFQESGAGAASLNVASHTMDLIMPSVGARFTRTFETGSYSWSPELRARYYHNLGDKRTHTKATMAGIGGAPFTVNGSGVGRHIGVVGAGVTIQAKENLQLSGSYDASFGNHATSHNFMLGLKVLW